MIELRTLGALELKSADGKPLQAVLTQPRRTALLCYLALESPRGFQRRDSVLATFWPEDDAEQARHALRQALYFLRRTLGAHAIVSRGDDELAVATDVIRCDATEFECALDAGRLQNALSLYRGELLPAFHVADAPGFERWLEAERMRLKRRAADGAWALAEQRERASDAAGAAEWGERAVSFAAGDELALRRLLTLLHRLGNSAAAVRAYDAFARELEREYELAPSEATRALLARIRSRQSEAVSARASEPGVAAPTAGQAAGDPPRPTPEAAHRVGIPGVFDSHLPAFGGLPPIPDSRAARRSTIRRASLGVGIATITLAGALAVGAWWLGPRAAAPSTRSAQRIVVADFTNRTSDSTFGDLVAHVLNAELAQSSVLRVVGRETIADAMRRMRRNAGERLTPELARDVATREGITLLLEGEARSAGSKVMLTASVIETASGDVIGGAVETVNDSADVLAAIRRLSGRLRQGIGESSASIRSAGNLWSLTTSSLPALRKHVAASRAYWRGDYQMAASLLTEATTLDPEFAHAHLLLWTSLEGSGAGRGRAMRSLVRAYELRDRLTERERYAVEANYFLVVVGDVQKAIIAFRKHIDALQKLAPGEPGWYSSLGNVLAMTGDLAGAERVLQEGRVRHPTPANLAGLVSVLHVEGKDAEIPAVLAEIAHRQLEHPNIVMVRVRLLADSGRYDAAHAVAAQPGPQPANRLKLQAEMDAVRGRIGEAVGHLGEVRDQALSRNQLGTAVDAAVAMGRLRALSGDTAGAVAEVAELLVRHPIDSLDALSRPYLTLATFDGEMGQSQRGRTWLAAYERDVPRDLRGPDQHMLYRARAAVRRAEGSPAQALAELRMGARLPSARTNLMDERIPLSDHPLLARVYEALGSRDSAIAVYERYLRVRSLSRTTLDAFELGNALERLGALHEAHGDAARAAEYYARLADLWREADTALRRRAASAGQRAHTLVTH